MSDLWLNLGSVCGSLGLAYGAFGPRIGLFGGPFGSLSILKKSPADAGCDRFFFEYASLAPGLGRCITTYEGNGKPLPSFRGEPKLVPLAGATADEVADAYWGALDAGNRVALTVKVVGRGDGAVKGFVVRNRHSQTA